MRQDKNTMKFYVLEVNSIPGIFQPSSCNDILDLYNQDFEEFLKITFFYDHLNPVKKASDDQL